MAVSARMPKQSSETCRGHVLTFARERSRPRKRRTGQRSVLLGGRNMASFGIVRGRPILSNPPCPWSGVIFLLLMQHTEQAEMSRFWIEPVRAIVALYIVRALAGLRLPFRKWCLVEALVVCEI